MAYDPRAIQRAMRGFLRSMNTTTASIDLSSSLAARMGDDRIMTGRPVQVPTAINQFPVVFIYPEDEAEDFSQMGNSTRSYQTYRINIECFSKLNQAVFPASANYDNAADAAERENMTLSGNIRAALRTDYQLSNTTGLLFGHIIAVRYNVIPPTAEQNTYIFGIRMVWEAKSLST